MDEGNRNVVAVIELENYPSRAELLFIINEFFNENPMEKANYSLITKYNSTSITFKNLVSY